MLMDRYSVRGKKVLMTVSRLASDEKYKGHDRVIRALPGVLSKHNEAIYLIVGDGDDRPRIEALVQSSGLTDKVRFAGRVAPEELPDHYRLADLLVMPSTGEGFGIVFLEAMATGIHVLGGDRDGSIDPLADGVLGSMVNPESTNELTSAICYALSHPSKGRVSRFNAQSFKTHLQLLVHSHFPPVDTCRL
jgi:phosphatidyl-myo-inositol dimannoside synthase